MERGIIETGPWKDLPEAAVGAFDEAARRILGGVSPDQTLNEANTEDKIIKPLIEALGWGRDHLSQMTAARKGRSDVPDILLFADSGALEAARSLPAPDAYKHGLAFLESKKWCRPLDRKDRKADDGVPSTQMLRYLNRVMVMSDGRILWGVPRRLEISKFHDGDAAELLLTFIGASNPHPATVKLPVSVEAV